MFGITVQHPAVRLFTAAILVCAGLYATTASAGLYSSSARLTGSDSSVGNEFGLSVALSGDSQTLLVGAQTWNNTGKVYVFSRAANGSWSQTSVITNPNTTSGSGNYFGAALAVSADGNTALVGAFGVKAGSALNAGAAYVFTRANGVWTLQHTLTEPAAAANDIFGVSVALSADGTTALIGASGAQAGTGAVYAYANSNGSWTQPVTLTAADSAANNHFGYRVGLSQDGSIALVSANAATVNGITQAGEAYFFARSGQQWAQTQAITEPTPAASDLFGAALGLSGDGSTAIIGALQSGGTGAAYVYTRNGGGWALQQSLASPAKSPINSAFGNAVAITPNGSTALVAAFEANVNGQNMVGQGYVFQRSGSNWTLQSTLDDPAPAAQDTFGITAALNGAGTTAFMGSNSNGMYVLDSPDDLSLALSADHQTVTPGQTFSYLFTVTNNDTQVTATNVTLTDTLPSGVTATTMSSGCSGSASTVTCTAATLAPGASFQPSITVTAPANATGQAFNVTNSATVSADQSDPNAANNNASLAVIVSASASGSGGSSGKSGGGAFGLLGFGLLCAVFGWRRRGKRA